MAASKFTSTEKREAFRLILLLSSSLRFVAEHLEQISASKIFSPQFIQETLALTQKVQTDITALVPSLEMPGSDNPGETIN